MRHQLRVSGQFHENPALNSWSCCCITWPSINTKRLLINSNTWGTIRWFQDAIPGNPNLEIWAKFPVFQDMLQKTDTPSYELNKVRPCFTARLSLRSPFLKRQEGRIWASTVKQISEVFLRPLPYRLEVSKHTGVGGVRRTSSWNFFWEWPSSECSWNPGNRWSLVVYPTKSLYVFLFIYIYSYI